MRGTRPVGFAALSGLLLLAGCDQGPSGDAIVEAAGFELTTNETAAMIVPVPEVPADPTIVETILEFWTDYTLLAWTVNQEGELAEMDLSKLVEQEESRAIVTRLRNQVIQPDTSITEEELRSAFEENRPGEAVHARHILLRLPQDATEAQRDSLYAVAEDLRARAVAGEDFAALAEEHSEDTASAVNGGDLGFFGQGEMVPPFEEAAFALDAGQISEVVESQFGLHVIRVEARETPTFEELSEQFRAELQNQRMMTAESIYLEEVETPENVEIAEGAYDLVRRISGNPTESLGGDASAPLTSYESGELTAEEFRGFMQGIPTQVRTQITQAPDPQIEQMLRDVTRDQIILADAEERGITLESSAIDSITTEIRSQYPEVAEFLGLASIEPEEGESIREAVDRAVDDLMTRIVANEQDVVPLGALAIPLRDRYDIETVEDAAAQVVARVNELRGPEGTGDAPTAPPAGMPAPDATPQSDPTGPEPAGGATPDDAGGDASTDTP